MELKPLDYLLIDYVSDLPASLNQICSKDARDIFNKPFHRMDRSEVFERLVSLKDLGLLSITNDKVFLTSKGGRIWEGTFKPKWNEYILLEESYRFGGEFIWVSCFNSHHLDLLVNSIWGEGVRFSSIKAVEGWRPKYWKKFRIGYRVFGQVLSEEVVDAWWASVCPAWRLNWRSADFHDGIDDFYL